MRFRASVSFEHDIRPVQTVRLEFEKEDFEAAFKTAVFLSFKQYPRWSPRSIVAVIENLDLPEVKS